MGRNIYEEADSQGWVAAKLESGRLVFNNPGGFAHALRSGFFFLDAENMCFKAGDRFARSFPFGPNPTTGFDYATLSQAIVGRYQGYFTRQDDQAKQFFIESRQWQRYLEDALVQQANQMRDVAVSILNAVLVGLELPHEIVRLATGGALDNRGTYTMTFNNFSNKLARRGLNIHKDSGWVTALRSISPGLEVMVGDDWRPISPIDGTLIINFGCAMEILTRNTLLPVAAAKHKVIAQVGGVNEESRFSYALFVDNGLTNPADDTLKEIDNQGGVVEVGKFSDFLDGILERTYDPSSVGLY